jgi:hypothetical protein
VKEQPWGAVLRVLTGTDQRCFFKASGPRCRHEVRIVADLTGRWPMLTPDVLAMDATRGWMLLADHGEPMADVLAISDQVATLEELLPAYAEMQSATTPCVPEWLAAGTPDRRVDRLPGLLRELLDGATPIGSLAIDAASRSAYRADVPRLAEVCADLATTTPASALDHSDLHGTNILVDGDRRRMADWGDACITHPFASLLAPYTLLVPSLPDSERRGAALRLRDAYLSAWGSTVENRRALGLAVWVGHVIRAVNIAYQALGQPSDHGEITSLLQAWHAKRSLLELPDEVVQP